MLESFEAKEDWRIGVRSLCTDGSSVGEAGKGRSIVLFAVYIRHAHKGGG